MECEQKFKRFSLNQALGGEQMHKKNRLNRPLLNYEKTSVLITDWNKHRSAVHCVALVVFSAGLFLPMIGRGFVLDDFGHLFVVQHESVRFGLTHSSGGPYFAPLAWLSFKLDWLLWGLRPYMWALSNLVLHICNTLLLYALAARVLRSRTAGWWTAFGLALLYPATVVAMLFVATRAHLIAALFYLLALNFAVYFVRAERPSPAYAIATIVSGILAIFSKESGVTVIAAIALVIAYERLANGNRKSFSAVTLLFVGLFVGLAAYLALRAQSGATPISFSGNVCCSYAPSFKVFAVNAVEYGLRTYGLLAVPGLAILISFFIRRRSIRLNSHSKYEALLSLTLFASAVTPVILLKNPQGIYNYLPGIGASLMLGLLVRIFDNGEHATADFFKPLTLLPVVLTVLLFVALTVKSSLKWIRLAEVNASVLKQIKTQQPTIPSYTFVRLSHTEADLKNRFPEGFGDWCFPYALRVIYGDRTLDGAIVREGHLTSEKNQPTEVRFSYVHGDTPLVSKTSEPSTR